MQHYSKDEKFLGNLTSHNRIIQVFPWTVKGGKMEEIKVPEIEIEVPKLKIKVPDLEIEEEEEEEWN